MLIDLAYLSIKTTIKVGYYLVKGTYNTVHNLNNSEAESKSADTDLINVIKQLNKEIILLKKDIQNLNSDSYVVVYPDAEIPKLAAENHLNNDKILK